MAGHVIGDAANNRLEPAAVIHDEANPAHNAGVAVSESGSDRRPRLAMGFNESLSPTRIWEAMIFAERHQRRAGCANGSGARRRECLDLAKLDYPNRVKPLQLFFDRAERPLRRSHDHDLQAIADRLFSQRVNSFANRFITVGRDQDDGKIWSRHCE